VIMITRKEGVPMVIRKISALVLALAVALMLTATPAVVLADPGTSVSIEDALGVPVGGTADVDIEITTDEANGLGSATITLTVDTAVVTVDSVASGALGTVYSNTVGGVTTMTWATGSSPGPSGSDLLFATVTLQAVGGAGECSDLDIDVTSMYDATAGSPQAIVPSPVTDGQFCIAGAAPTPTPTPVTPTPTPTPTPTTEETTVAVDCCSDVPVGGSCDVDITIETGDPQGIGSATITLTVDTAVVSVGTVAAGDLGTVYSNTVGDTTTMSAATGASPGPTGTVTFATVTLNAVGSSGACSALDIAVTSINDGTAGDPQPITPDAVTDCTFCIGIPPECDWTFPHGLNTDPSAVFSRYYDCIPVSLPANDPAELISVWYYDEAVPEWKWYKPGWPESTLTSLEQDNIYQVIVQDATTWTIPQP
jgi:hypothetical protein